MPSSSKTNITKASTRLNVNGREMKAKILVKTIGMFSAKDLAALQKVCDGAVDALEKALKPATTTKASGGAN